MDIDPTLNPAIFQGQAVKPNAQAPYQRSNQQRADVKSEATSTRSSPVAVEESTLYSQSTLNIRETISSPPPLNAINSVGASTRSARIDNTNNSSVVIERKHTPATQTFLQVAGNGEEFRLIDLYV